MDKNSTKYVIGFVFILTFLIALLLTGLREATKGQADINEDIFNKRAILAAVNDHLAMGDGVLAKDLPDDQILQIFEDKIQQFVVMPDGNPVEGVMAEDIDMKKEKKKDAAERQLPLFIYENEGKQFYILAVRGNGLWDEIWGYIALGGDLNTIAGASFDHQGETPGLGAEIKDNPSFSANFKGTQILDADGEYVSVNVRKGGRRGPEYVNEVDGISGATVTADGVSKMLDTGIEAYLPYLEKIEK